MTSARALGHPGGHAHRLAPGTHTVEMAQLAEIDEALVHAPPTTAAELGLADAPVHEPPGDRLPAAAVLVRLAWSGDPAFPDIHAVFAETPGAPGGLEVDLHTAALRALSSRLGLRHSWGVGQP